MPKVGSGSGSVTEDSEVYDEGICFCCKRALEDTPDDTMCVVCHRYSHLGCTDLKGHPRLASLVSTKALEFRISKDPDIRRLMENVTVSHIGKLALFKYHCPTCRKKLSRARQYDESQCRALFNTLIELINKSEILQPQIPAKKNPGNICRKVKLEPCDTIPQKHSLSTRRSCSRSKAVFNSTKESKLQPTMAPSREPLNKKRIQSQKGTRDISSDSSSEISETSSVPSDNFRPSRISSDAETDSDYLQSVDTDQDQQDNDQKSYSTDVQAFTPPSRRNSHKIAQHANTKATTRKSRTKKSSGTRQQSARVRENMNKQQMLIDEETQRLIDLKKSQFNDPEYLFKHHFKRICHGFEMSRVYKVAGNLYKKIYFKDVRDRYHFQIKSLTEKIKTIEAASANLLSKMSIDTKRDFENIYSRLNRKKFDPTYYKAYVDTHPQVLEDSDEENDSDIVMSIYIKYTNALGKYLLVKKIYITHNSYSIYDLRTVDFKRLLYNTEFMYNTPLIKYKSVQFIPIEAQFLNNFHDYFNNVTTEDMLLSIENKNEVPIVYMDFAKSSAIFRFSSADFLCDTIVTPNQIADNQFFIFSIRYVCLFNYSLFTLCLSTGSGQNQKSNFLADAITQMISYRNIDPLNPLYQIKMNHINLSPYEFPEMSQQVSNMIDGLKLIPVYISNVSSNNNSMRTLTHPIFDSIFKACISKEFIQQTVKHDGRYYRVEGWTSNFMQLDVSLASVNPLESTHFATAYSAAPPSLDAISGNLSIYSRTGGVLFGRLYEYIEEICYLMSCDFKEESLPELPENCDDSRIVFDPAFYYYERSIRQYILSMICPINFFETVHNEDALISRNANRLMDDFNMHMNVFKPCYRAHSYSAEDDPPSGTSESNNTINSNEDSAEDDNIKIIPKQRRASIQSKRRVRV